MWYFPAKTMKGMGEDIRTKKKYLVVSKQDQYENKKFSKQNS